MTCAHYNPSRRNRRFVPSAFSEAVIKFDYYSKVKISLFQDLRVRVHAYKYAVIEKFIKYFLVPKKKVFVITEFDVMIGKLA